MGEPTISVIIPVYKTEKYIHKCLDSVLNQTYKNLEVILVDDGSPDNCPVICDEYAQKDSRIKVFHKENGGLSSARNLGLDNMTGDYVSFVDSDDYIESDMIETMLNQLKSKNGDIAICLAKNDDEKRFEGDIYKNILEDRIGSQVWRYLYSAEKFEKKRFPLNRYVEDIAILHKVLYRSKIVYVSRRFYNYCYNPESISNSPDLQKIYKNTVDRAIAFLGRYEWMKDKSDIMQDSKEIILHTAVRFCLATFARYRNNKYSQDDIDVIYRFIKANKKQILKSKKFSFTEKTAVRFLLLMPNFFSRVGSLAMKIKG